MIGNIFLVKKHEIFSIIPFFFNIRPDSVVLDNVLQIGGSSVADEADKGKQTARDRPGRSA